MFSSLESTLFLCVETVLLVLPEFLTGPETLCAVRLVPPVLSSALCLLESTLVGVAEGEGSGGGEAHVKVLFTDLVYAGVAVVGDANALESEEEDFCETDVVESERDLDLVLEGLWTTRKRDARLEDRRLVGDWMDRASAFLGSLSCEGDRGYVAGSAAVLHVWMESCGEHLGGGRGAGGEDVRTDR